MIDYDKIAEHIKTKLEKSCQAINEGKMELKDLGDWCYSMQKFIDLYDD